MRLRLSSRDRRAAIGGGVIVAMALGARHALPALTTWSATQLSSAAVDLRTLDEARAARAELPRLVDSARVRRARVDSLDSLLLVAQTPTEAVADLASILEALADSSALRVASIQIRADSAHAGYARVGVRISGTTDVRGLADFLSVVESDDPPWMAVRELDVTQPDPAAVPSKPEALHVDILVESLALMRRGPKT